MSRFLCAVVFGTGLLAGCSSSDAPPEVSSQAAEDPQIARLIKQMESVPGEVAVTRSTGQELDAPTRKLLASASKVVHVYSDGHARAYVSREVKAPEGVTKSRVFYEPGEDVVVGRADELAEYILRHELSVGKASSVLSTGLPPGHGGLFPGGTVPYEIDGSFVGAELTTLRQSIGTWNESRGPAGEPLRVRFVPRYPNDGRPYVRFVRTPNGSGFCGQSMVGRHDNVFTNWWSHNIDITCVDQRVIHHEMGHTVGLYHEHQRCDRDQYVGVSGTNHNCTSHCWATDYGLFNYRSVMAYWYHDTNACSIEPRLPSNTNHRGEWWMWGTASGLDAHDVAGINDMYRGHATVPNFRAGTYYTILPQHAPGKGIIIGGHDRNNGTEAIQWQSLPVYLDQHWEIVPDGSGFFEIKNRNSGLCLEIKGWTMRDGAPIGQWSCFGADHQKWTIAPSTAAPGSYSIINKWSNKSIDIEGFHTHNGARVQQWPHHGDTNQRFVFSLVF